MSGLTYSNHILVAEDNEALRKLMVRDLMAAGHRVSWAGHGSEAMRLLDEHEYQVVIAGMELPGAGGMELVARLQESSPNTAVIILGQSQEVEQAVEVMRAGAFHYQPKPVNLEHLRLMVERALERSSLHHAFSYLRHEQPYLYRLESITAESPAMQRVLSQVGKLAPTNITVLLTGETGTGKSLVAGAIHANSPRREATLVTVNCAALSETLLESELFGHEKGAFTGAHKARAGRFQQAHGGTLFLDEVGEMSPALQAKVLRAIEDQVIHRLGGSREIHVDVRIIAATNRDLAQSVARGEFRKDLYYRLNVAPLHIAPLHERQADVLPLAERFLERLCAETGRPAPVLSTEARQLLLSYQWPGNIRELRNSVERAALFSENGKVTAEDLSLPNGSPTLAGASAPQAPEPAEQGYFVAQSLDLEQLERTAIEVALQSCGWVQKDAAELLGITPSRMTYKLNKLGIKNSRFRAKRRRR